MKKVIVMRKAQSPTHGGCLMIEREIYNDNSRANLGVTWVNNKEEIEQRYGEDLVEEIWSSLPELDGEDSNDAIRITITIEKTDINELNTPL